MFGSAFPDQIEMGIDAIVAAQFVIVTENSLSGRVHDANVTAINGFLRSTAAASHVSEGPTVVEGDFTVPVY